ncbi:nucleolar protein,Nop52-domain-containing protein [Xylariomycetidae sp. FL2044]|nr:nucleolar protein,Nop52-domain-containing protein [Xylariomycetidae sp. FL2044]
MANTDGANMPFVRNLGSSDRKTRTLALDSLRTYLTSVAAARQLSPLDNLKLWKGLFYSLWMCDRPLPQQNLCAELAALTDVLPDEAVIPWLEGFWATMAREWTGIDVLRLEKFLLLVRRVFAANLAWVIRRRGEARAGAGKKKARQERIDDLMGLLAAWPFEKTADLSKVPVGLRLHVLDIWVDEADKLDLLEEEESSAEAAGELLLGRIRELVEDQTGSTCKPVRIRARESLTDERLPWNVSEDTNHDDEDDDDRSGEEKVSGDRGGWDGFDD